MSLRGREIELTKAVQRIKLSYIAKSNDEKHTTKRKYSTTA